MTEKLQKGCTVQPQRIEELAEIIYNTCLEKGWDCDLNFIDTSKITNMCCLFADSDIKEDLDYIASIMNIKKFDLSKFNGDISRWDTSNVTDMSNMFEGAVNFNSDLSAWNTSNVKYMKRMFCEAESFNQSLDNWNVSNVEDMSNMFWGAQSFNQPLNNWNVSNVTNMSCMFANATSFNHPLENWDVSNVEYMHSMFYHAKSFNSQIPKFELFEFSREDPSEELRLDPNVYNPEINKEQVQKNSQQKGRVR